MSFPPVQSHCQPTRATPGRHTERRAWSTSQKKSRIANDRQRLARGQALPAVAAVAAVHYDSSSQRKSPCGDEFMTSKKLEIRGNLESAYADVFTAEAVASLEALAGLDADRKAVMVA